MYKHSLLFEPPLRQSSLTGLLGTIDSYMPENHQYKDNDYVTYAHETLHGISARLRNKYKEEYGDVNIIYMENTCFLIMEQPPLTIKDIADQVPDNKRGNMFDLYLVKQRKYWNKQPLYILEECNCYLYGGLVGRENNLKERAEYSLNCAMEILEYVKIMSNMSDVDYQKGFNRYINKFAQLVNNDV